jgi:hypothetical protein
VLHALSARAWRDSARAEKVLSSPTPSRRSLRLDAELGDDAAGEDANSREPGARERGLGVRAGVRAADMSDVVGRGARCAVNAAGGVGRTGAASSRGGPVTGD